MSFITSLLVWYWIILQRNRSNFDWCTKGTTYCAKLIIWLYCRHTRNCTVVSTSCILLRLINNGCTNDIVWVIKYYTKAMIVDGLVQLCSYHNYEKEKICILVKCNNSVGKKPLGVHKICDRWHAISCSTKFNTNSFFNFLFGANVSNITDVRRVCICIWSLMSDALLAWWLSTASVYEDNIVFEQHIRMNE